MIQQLEKLIYPKNQIKQIFGDYFYQIGQDKYQTSKIRQLSIQFRNLTKDLDELGKLENKQNKKYKYEQFQLIKNKNYLVDVYINRIEQITKEKITSNEKLTLNQIYSNDKLEQTKAIKLAGNLTGITKFEIFEKLEELLG